MQVLPTPPTDNYHKFMAIAGLWLVVGSVIGLAVGVIYLQNQIYDARLRIIVNKVDGEGLAAETENQKRDMERFEATRAQINEFRATMERNLSDVERLQSLRNPTTKQRADARIQIDVLKAQNEVVHEILATMSIDLDKLSKAIDESSRARLVHRKEVLKAVVVADRLRDLYGWLIQLYVLGAILGATGFALALVGLGKWRDIQGVQDQLLGLELSEMKQRSSKSTAS